MFSKKSDLEKLAERQEAAEYDPKYDDDSGGIMAFLRNRGSRETFESVLIAIVLALLFRNFLGEAYIIPTGSMAPVLQGRHIDMACEECGYQYRTGASSENNIGTNVGEVRKTVCPICQKINTLQRRDRRDHRSFAGDRILVNKFIYDFQSPERWDVIVFKYPNNGKQNYIKRCIGIAGEGLLLENGDVYTFNLANETFADRAIARKDHRKLRAMLQLVDDTFFIAEKLKDVQWPSRWDQWNSKNKTWKIDDDGEHPVFINSGDAKDTQWLRYRHLRPRITRAPPSMDGTQWNLNTEWEQIELGERPPRLDTDKGELITDHYAYNESQESRRDGKIAETIGFLGLNWVGDVGVECDLKVENSEGIVAFDIVEGGVHFTCTIDVKTGEATLSTSKPVSADSTSNVWFVDDDGKEVESPAPAKTSIVRAGSYSIRFMNADDQLYLWVNNSPIMFDVSKYKRTGDVVPKWTKEDGLDAEPIGIGAKGASLKINRLKVVRDVYYTSANKNKGEKYINIQNEYVAADGSPNRFETQLLLNSAYKVVEILRDPESWQVTESRVHSLDAKELFDSRKRDESFVFTLNKYPDDPRKDEFMPMGDNSPQSSDARVWPGHPHVDREFLLGRAMYVYWPHAKNTPVPFWPNFERMKLIR